MNMVKDRVPRRGRMDQFGGGTRGRLLALTVACGLIVTGCATVSPASPSPTATPPVGGPGQAAPSQEPAVVSPPPSPDTPVSTPSPATSITLSKNGIGSFKFGASKEKVSAYLTKLLGSPKTDPSQDGVGECEGGLGLWQTQETYGNLTVEYDGKTASSKSPQTLAAWSLRPAQKPKAPLALAKGIPVGLTMKQLKARYPGGDAGGLDESMGVWFVSQVAIFPPSGDDGGMIFAGRINWCT